MLPLVRGAVERPHDLLALPAADGHRHVPAGGDAAVGEQRGQHRDGAAADLERQGRREHAG
jgi:hypothetical protein